MSEGTLRRVVVLLALGLFPLLGSVAQASTEASLEEQILPRLEARQADAVARVRAADAFFDGTAPDWRQAFPELAGIDLFDSGALALERRRRLMVPPLTTLATGPAACARQRLEPPTIQGAPLEARAEARWRTALEAACTAEAEVAARLDRFLTGMAAGLERALAFRRERLRTEFTRLQDLQDQARIIVLEVEPRGDARTQAILQRAAAAAETVAAWRRYADAAVPAMTAPDAAALLEYVSADLERLNVTAAPAEGRALSPETILRDGRLRRLEAALPLLPSSEARRVREGLVAAWQARLAAEIPALRQRRAAAVGLAAPQEGADFDPGLAQRRQDVERRIPEIRRWAEDPPSLGEAALDPRLAAWARLRLEVAELERARLDLVERGAGDGDPTTAQDTETQAASARAAAAAARERAQADEGTSEDRERRRRVADLQERAARLLEWEGARHDRRQDLVQRLEEDLQAARILGRKAAEKATLEPGRQGELDSAYRNLEDLRARLDDHLWIQKGTQDLFEEERRLWMRTLPTLPAGPAGGESAEIAGAWERARNNLDHALHTRWRNARQEMDDLLRLTDEVKTERRWLRPLASRQLRRPGLLLTELDFEVWEGRQRIESRARGLLSWIGEERDRRSILHLAFLLLTRGLVLLGLVALWWMSRRGLARLAQPSFWSGSAGQDSPHGQAEVIRSAVDVVPAFVLFRLVRGELLPGVELLRLLTLLLLAAALYRLLLRAARMLLAVAQAEDDLRTRALETVRLFLRLALGALLLRHLAFDFLAADRLHNTLTWIFALGAAAAVPYWLLEWAPYLRQVLHRHATPGSLAYRLGRRPANRRQALGQAGAGLLVLAARGLSRSTRRRDDQVSWLDDALARRQLRSTDGPQTPLRGEIRHAIRDAGPGHLPRKEDEAALQAAFDAWRPEAQRGMVAVVGDRGLGKSHFLHRARTVLSREGEPPLNARVLEPSPRTTDPATALQWLHRSLEVEGRAGDDPDELREAIHRYLEDAEPHLFQVDDMHHLMLRCVSGLEALRLVLETMHRASGKHCWILAFHGPAWSYLTATAVGLDLEMFRARVGLDPASPKELREWLHGRTRKANFEPTYWRLEPHGASRQEQEQVLGSFWQLLARDSEGNPEVALNLWLDALCEGKDQEEADPAYRRLEVRLFPTRRAAELKRPLSHDELFILKALTVHGGLSAAALARALNRPVAELRETLLNLEERRIVHHDADTALYDVRFDWQTEVRRVLYSKHFLHQEEA